MFKFQLAIIALCIVLQLSISKENPTKSMTKIGSFTPENGRKIEYYVSLADQKLGYFDVQDWCMMEERSMKPAEFASSSEAQAVTSMLRGKVFGNFWIGGCTVTSETLSRWRWATYPNNVVNEAFAPAWISPMPQKVVGECLFIISGTDPIKPVHWSAVTMATKLGFICQATA